MQLAWKSNSSSLKVDTCGNLGSKRASYNGEPRWKKSGLKRRRSQRLLKEFLCYKGQPKSTQVRMNSVPVAPEWPELMGDPIVEHPPAKIDLLACKSVAFQMDSVHSRCEGHC